jgi:hypothetical protein
MLFHHNGLGWHGPKKTEHGAAATISQPSVAVS